MERPTILDPHEEEQQQAVIKLWSRPFPFLQLPFELQVMVFEKLLKPRTNVYTFRSPYTLKRGGVHSLFLVNKEISEAFRYVYYRSRTLILLLRPSRCLSDQHMVLKATKKDHIFTRIYLQMNLLCLGAFAPKQPCVWGLGKVLRSVFDSCLSRQPLVAVEMRICNHKHSPRRESMPKEYAEFFRVIGPYLEKIFLSIALEAYRFTATERLQYIEEVLKIAEEVGVDFKHPPKKLFLSAPYDNGHYMPPRPQTAWFWRTTNS